MTKSVTANTSLVLAGLLILGSLLAAPLASAQNQAADAGGIQLNDQQQAQQGETSAKAAAPANANPQPWTLKKGNDTAPWRAERNQAVQKARAGNYTEALSLLQKLHNDHPQDSGATQDMVAISSWAGRDQDAVSLFKTLPSDVAEPDYVLEAVGRSYRNLHQPDNALDIYRHGLAQSPDNVNFAVGEVRSLDEAGRTDEAMQAVAQHLSRRADKPQELIQANLDLRHNYAVKLGRDNHNKEAVDMLAKLHNEVPRDVTISRDYVWALAWAGRDQDAISLYETLPAGQQPDYVLGAVAHAYRDLHKPQQALDTYREGRKQYPNNADFATGEVNSLIDLGKVDEAQKLANSESRKDPATAQQLAAAARQAEEQQAIALARGGKYAEALARLTKLRTEHPQDNALKLDTMVVLCWSGRDLDGINMYRQMEAQPMPDYALEAVGKSYRNLHRYKEGAAVYRRGLKQSPKSETLVVGLVRCLMEDGQNAEALKIAEGNLKAYGDRFEVLLAATDAAERNNQPFVMLTHAQKAQAIAPNNKEALIRVVRADDHIGAPQLALAMADSHPGLIGESEHRGIEGDMSSRLVRWGPLEPVSEAARYDEIDKSIALLDDQIARWEAAGAAPDSPEVLRARFDRIVALRNRVRMQEVIQEYDDMAKNGIFVPYYALSSVGDAYLYLREPEKARNAYLMALAQEPEDYETRRQLFFAYVECNDIPRAYATIDTLVADQPVWFYLKNEVNRLPNPNRSESELDAADARLYGQEFAEAQKRIEALAFTAPQDPRNRASLGNIYLTRGWPTRALEEYEIGNAISENKSAPNQVGIAEANLDLHNYPESEAMVKSLMQRYPENLPVQRAAEEWDIHNMAELQVHAGYDFRPANSAQGGNGYGIDTLLYSAPIMYNWRLFAGEYFAHEAEPQNEGSVSLSRSTAGVEYRKGPITVQGGPTYNHFNGSERVGVAGEGSYQFNDQWSAGAGAEMLSRETPLRALNAGVTAHMADANVTWRQSDERQVHANTYVMPFSDGNFRTGQDADYAERLYTNPWLWLDSVTSAASMQNTRDEARPYFNPSFDFLGLTGLRAINPLYQRYDTYYQHSIELMPGGYWQQHYGVAPSWLVRYEQTFRFQKVFQAGWGISYLRHDYDGTPEDSVSLTFELTEHF